MRTDVADDPAAREYAALWRAAIIQRDQRC
jgi:hypothetical protein